MVEVLFKGGKVQTGYRIKIPKAIIDTLDLKSGASINIIFNVAKKEIIIREEKKGVKK